MRDIVDGIALKISKDNIKMLSEVSNELSNEGIDVEHLITLYEASGTRKHDDIAKELKKLFREEIQDRIKELGEEFSPNLLISLIDMHSIESLDEELTAILTLNYDDLIERAVQCIKGGINYTINSINKGSLYTIKNDSVPVLKLHGSFNWKNEYPIAIMDEIKDEKDVLWIPPGVVKSRANYPFSIIWGKAKELLACDILRIIGCSLSRNDWELVSLLFSTQKLRSDGKQYILELIDYPKHCNEIIHQYKYLNIRTILDIPEVLDYLVHVYFPHKVGHPISESLLTELRENISPGKFNIFEIWLRAKGEQLLEKGSISTSGNNYFEKFIKGEPENEKEK